MRALLLSLLALSGCVASTKPELGATSARPLRLEQRLELTLPRHPSGAPWSLAASRGKVVLLDVWATWCEPCRESMPLYEDLQKEFGAHGFEVMTINVDDDPSAIGPFFADTRVTLPAVTDPGAARVTELLKVQVMPTAVLVDRKGFVRHVHEGFNEDLLSTWLEEIQALLSEAP